MFPQLGAPIGFLCASGTFLFLTTWLSDVELFAWGWRIPFIASALLVFVGLYVRLRLAETPAFRHAIENNERVRLPVLTVCVKHRRALLLGTFSALTPFVLFYLMTVFSLSWGTTALGYTRAEFLILQMIGVLFFWSRFPSPR
jgi:MFS family permease